MMVEEVKKAKELVTMQPKVKGGDDEPDWQNVSSDSNMQGSKTRGPCLPLRIIKLVFLY